MSFCSSRAPLETMLLNLHLWSKPYPSDKNPCTVSQAPAEHEKALFSSLGSFIYRFKEIKIEKEAKSAH